ncbi:hypothetical protein GCM10009800_54640 [Nocardiopsis rhodophaea]
MRGCRQAETVGVPGRTGVLFRLLCGHVGQSNGRVRQLRYRLGWAPDLLAEVRRFLPRYAGDRIPPRPEGRGILREVR